MKQLIALLVLCVPGIAQNIHVMLGERPNGTPVQVLVDGSSNNMWIRMYGAQPCVAAWEWQHGIYSGPHPSSGYIPIWYSGNPTFATFSYWEPETYSMRVSEIRCWPVWSYPQDFRVYYFGTVSLLEAYNLLASPEFEGSL